MVIYYDLPNVRYAILGRVRNGGSDYFSLLLLHYHHVSFLNLVLFHGLTSSLSFNEHGNTKIYFRL